MSTKTPSETVCVITPVTPVDDTRNIPLNELLSRELGTRGWNLVLSGTSPWSAVLAESAHKRGSLVSLFLPYWQADRIDPALPAVEIQLAESVEGQFRRIARVTDHYLVIAETSQDLGQVERITGSLRGARPITVLARSGHWPVRPEGGAAPPVTAEVDWNGHTVVLTSDGPTAVATARRWRVALVGAGKIGAALCGYADFRRQGFHIEAAFDSDPRKVGEEWGGLRVRPAAE